MNDEATEDKVIEERGGTMVEMKKLKTELKIDETHFYAPYISLFVENAEELKQIWEQIMRNVRRNEIFECVED